MSRNIRYGMVGGGRGAFIELGALIGTIIAKDFATFAFFSTCDDDNFVTFFNISL